MKYDLKILQEYIDKKLIHMQVHPTLPLRIYKYSQECVFSRAWDEITLNMRGTVLDIEGNQLSNPFPKFFNLEELQSLGISLPKLPYKVYDKADGSLIEIFMFQGNYVVSSAGSFTSAQAVVAEKLLKEKYANLIHWSIMPGKTYLFELIYPLNKIVLNYGDEEKLVLLAIRDTDTGYEMPDVLYYAKGVGFDVVDEIKMSLDELKNEIQRADFINKEGFVVAYENGFRVKMKYAEYFRLHKIVCNVNERFVWEFMSQGKPLELTNIPDETFQFIKDTQKSIQEAFDAKWSEADNVYRKICLSLNQKYGHDNWEKKDFALIVVPEHKKLSGVLFKMYENRLDEAKEIIWKIIEPKYEKGVSGFQSMKIGV